MKTKSKPRYLRRHMNPMAMAMAKAMAKEMVEVVGVVMGAEMEENHQKKDSKESMCRWCLLGKLEVPLHHRTRRRKRVGTVSA
jgi:hypothetical protein